MHQETYNFKLHPTIITHKDIPTKDFLFSTMLIKSILIIEK